MPDEHGRPQRIQCLHVKGWRAPAGAINVARPSKYANPLRWTEYPKWVNDACGEPLDEPIRISDAQRRRFATKDFESSLLHLDYGALKDYPSIEQIRADLAGHDLLCCCPMLDEHGHHGFCHADVLLVVANTPEGLL